MLPKSTTLLMAVTAIFVGVLLLLGNMGVLPPSITGLWPVVLIVAGLVALTCFEGEKKQQKKK